MPSYFHSVSPEETEARGQAWGTTKPESCVGDTAPPASWDKGGIMG